MKLNHKKKKKKKEEKKKERKFMHLFCFCHFEILEFNSLELTYMNRIKDDC